MHVVCICIHAWRKGSVDAGAGEDGVFCFAFVHMEERALQDPIGGEDNVIYEYYILMEEGSYKTQ